MTSLILFMFISISFDAQGNFISITNKVIGQTIPFQQQYLYYQSNIGDKISSQPSGAYPKQKEYAIIQYKKYKLNDHLMMVT